MHSLKRAGPLLIRVAVFGIFATVLFSIIGQQSFSGSFRRTCIMTDPHNSSNVISLGNQCGGWLDGITLEAVGYLDSAGNIVASPKGYICPLGQVCQVRCLRRLQVVCAQYCRCRSRGRTLMAARRALTTLRAQCFRWSSLLRVCATCWLSPCARSDV